MFWLVCVIARSLQSVHISHKVHVLQNIYIDTKNLTSMVARLDNNITHVTILTYP